MSDVPRTRFVRDPDGDIAYTTLGQGLPDVVAIVADLSLGSEITFTDRGMRELKGVPGDRQLFAAASPS